MAAVVGLVVTASIVVVPSPRLAYQSAGAHLVLETAVTLVAALVALLSYGRYRRGAAVRDLLLVYAMSLLAVGAMVFAVVPELVGDERGARASAWVALVVRLAGSVLFLSAAVIHPSVRHRLSRPRLELSGVPLLIGAIGGVVVLIADRLPDVVQVSVAAESHGGAALSGHPVALVAQVVNCLCFAGASLAFTRQSARDGDEMLGWFGAASALAAWARLGYLVYPSLYTDWVYAGDLLRLGFYVLLVVGAVREIRTYWQAQATVAVHSERRRLARDLHDGVVQELGYIRSQAARSTGGDEVGRIGAAAERALDEARRAISALASDGAQGLSEALRAAVTDVSDRYDRPVQLDLDEDLDVEPELREALVRIAREAVANAVRHAGEAEVRVSLRLGALVVKDDGCGFDPSKGRPGGFGLTSMRERAASVGAVVRLTSVVGKGTTVEVVW